MYDGHDHDGLNEQLVLVLLGSTRHREGLLHEQTTRSSEDFPISLFACKIVI